MRTTLAAAAAAALLSLSSCSDVLLDAMAKEAVKESRPSSLDPASGTMIAAHEEIVLVFTKDMGESKLEVSGSLGPIDPELSSGARKNDTLILRPADSEWSAGTGRELVVKVSEGGYTSSFEYSFEVFRGVCVRGGASNASDSDTELEGSQRYPNATIQGAIANARAKYPSGAVQVRVAPHVGGSDYYAVDGTSESDRITCVEGVSILGGCSDDWKSRDAAANICTIQASATANAKSIALLCGSGITRATVIEGLSIVGATVTGNASSYAISCQAGAKPTIRDCRILAGAEDASSVAPNLYAIGVGGVSGKSGPAILGCSINDSVSCGGGDALGCYGIYLVGSFYDDALVEGSLIHGGVANGTSGWSAAIYVEGQNGSASIASNEIRGGSAAYGYGLLVFGSDPTGAVTIHNNLILSAAPLGASQLAGVYLWGVSDDVALRNNTIVATVASSSPVFGLYCDSNAEPVLQNDIIHIPHVDGTYTCFAFHDTNDGYVDPENCSLSCDVAYCFGASNTPSVLGLGGTGNLTDDPQLDAEYQPGASAVRTGGLNGNDLGWPFSDDKDGRARTPASGAGWSMGCYEVD
ncbi:MAG TPA: right-handed parallel beta-helix repeat-containing protein [Spirochaetales bacterium]|nr:right-handed parallel beta-helix repeat-containing protein [Spirochaetales bacterium]HRY55110.1 right-handed parallel beta-helix repeat-containing protein [Spirochaetia bacterium]HRZ63871.1 right-handed parallel beta-helix repeat-containing protein [Spirochaetia bacterium]